MLCNVTGPDSENQLKWAGSCENGSQDLCLCHTKKSLKGCGLFIDRMADVSISKGNPFPLCVNLSYLQCTLMCIAYPVVMRSGSHTMETNYLLNWDNCRSLTNKTTHFWLAGTCPTKPSFGMTLTMEMYFVAFRDYDIFYRQCDTERYNNDKDCKFTAS